LVSNGHSMLARGPPSTVLFSPYACVPFMSSKGYKAACSTETFCRLLCMVWVINAAITILHTQLHTHTLQQTHTCSCSHSGCGHYADDAPRGWRPQRLPELHHRGGRGGGLPPHEGKCMKGPLLCGRHAHARTWHVRQVLALSGV